MDICLKFDISVVKYGLTSNEKQTLQLLELLPCPSLASNDPSIIGELAMTSNSFGKFSIHVMANSMPIAGRTVADNAMHLDRQNDYSDCSMACAFIDCDTWLPITHGRTLN